MERQNITIALPKGLVRRARHLAVERGTSLSGLLAEFLDRLVREADKRERAKKNLRRLLNKGFNLGTSGQISWTRDELHER
ncbi:MAG: CopG family transcriptional regulator [Deltaproteobacteria bacterium]|nr:CopG family transcriptional regulator [Deltaproteobacteria bacterium]